MKEQEQKEKENKTFAASVHILLSKWRDGTFSELFDDWKWIFGYSTRYKKSIVLYVVLGILSTSLGLMGSVAGKYLIDIITGYQMNRLGALVVIMVFSSVISMALENLINRVSTQLSIRINNDIQADVFDKIMASEWLAMNAYTNGDLLNRFNGDIKTVSGNAVSWLPTVILSVYKFAATFFVILHYDWIMAVIALGSAPVMLLCSRFLLGKQREYGKKVRESSSELMTFEVEAFYNYDTIKSFGITSFYSRKMRHRQAGFRDIALRYNMFTIKSNILLSVMGLVMQFVAFFYCLFRLWTHEITYGTMTLFLQQRSSLSSAFNQSVSVIPAFLNSSISARRIREITELPKEVQVTENPDTREYPKEGLKIQMKGIEFAYTHGQEILTDASFLANPGEITALVGPSGEGKTTMIRLILGLVKPQKGEAVLAGVSGREMELGVQTRYLFSYVPQGNTILGGTVAENMRMVKEDATDEEIISALQTACAWEFVEKMPEGLYSSVGERGRGLSEGQAQRIAIARAVLKDAPVLLLDEATSALDVATERKVLRNIIRRRPDKTCIVTTHRPSVLNLCQRVYRVMDKELVQLSEEEAARMAMDF